MTSATASAPAKVILTGEHAVVYNEPALVMAINRRAHVSVTTSRGDSVVMRSQEIGESVQFPLERSIEQRVDGARSLRLLPFLTLAQQVAQKAEYSGGLQISIQSEIPIAAGLGSSAAIGVAMSAALGKCLGVKLSRDRISKIAYESEKLIHGYPSGIDNVISAYGGLIVFRRNEGFLPVESHTRLQIVIGMTGVERSTAEQVARVAETVREHGEVGKLLLHCIGHLTAETVGALRERKIKAVGKLLSLNHWLVNALGVSHPLLDQLVHASLEAGALGAKLTGAGGGGCMIALVTNQTKLAVAQAIEREGGASMHVRLSRAGVQSKG